MHGKHFAVLLIIFLCAGCAHTGSRESPGFVMTTEAFDFFSGEYKNTQMLKKDVPESIAVAPFAYKGEEFWSTADKDEDPSRIVRRGMYNHISSLPFKDLEIREINRRLRNAGIPGNKKIMQLLEDNPRKLKSILGVDALVIGNVTSFERVYLGVVSQIAVGCEVSMFDLDSGELLWTAEHTSRAAAGGISLSPLGLALDAVASLWNLREGAMLEQTDNLFREIVSTIDIPESLRTARIEPPKINLFTTLNADRPFKAGEKISFRLIGDPDCKAYVDLLGFKSSINLRPVSPKVKEALQSKIIKQIQAEYKKTGHELTSELKQAIRKEIREKAIYEGSYTVEPGEQAYGLMAKGYLVAGDGGQAFNIDALHNIDVDGRPPGAPTKFSARSLNTKAELSWKPPEDKDIAFYRVLLSSTPLSGYTLEKKCEKNQTIVKDLKNFQTVYLITQAVDKAGNQGKKSVYRECVPLPEPGIFDLPQPGPKLSGKISGKIFLNQKHGPFRITNSVTVSKGSTVFVGPGAVLLMQPNTGIRVKGTFKAFGLPGERIEIRPVSGDSGGFKGVFLDGAKSAALHRVDIEHARTGITIKKCAPVIRHCKISGCTQAGLKLKSGARPEISFSGISENSGMGALIISGKGLRPTIHNNEFTNNAPFHVQSYAPIEIDISGNFWDEGKSTGGFLGNLKIEPELEKSPLDSDTKNSPGE